MTQELKLKYRAVIEFLMLEGETCANIHTRLVNVYAEDAPSLTTVKNWVWEFKRGKSTLEDEPRSGRPREATSEEMIAAARAVVEENRRASYRCIAEQLGISKDSVMQIMKNELKMRKICKVWVPHSLTQENKDMRVDFSRILYNRCMRSQEKFFSQLVTMDESMLPDYEPLSRTEGKVWVFKGESAPTEVQRKKTCGKTMLIVFWDEKGVLLEHYVPRGVHVNAAYHKNLLIQLRSEIKEKRRGMLSRGVLLQQDNARTHTAQVAIDEAMKCGFEILPHPPYSPDLAPSDYYLFRNLKKDKRGNRFATEDELKNWTTNWLAEKDEAFFRKGIRMLKDRWQRCIEQRGEYLT